MAVALVRCCREQSFTCQGRASRSCSVLSHLLFCFIMMRIIDSSAGVMKRLPITLEKLFVVTLNSSDGPNTHSCLFTALRKI